MSVGAALLALAFAFQTPQLAYFDGAYSGIERHLDRAQEHLVQAQTYTCSDKRAQRALAPVEQRYAVSRDSARQLLGRELNLKIWTNSCRSAGDGPRFRSLLRKADKAVRQAATLIRRGDTQ